MKFLLVMAIFWSTESFRDSRAVSPQIIRAEVSSMSACEAQADLTASMTGSSSRPVKVGEEETGFGRPGGIYYRCLPLDDDGTPMTNAYLIRKNYEKNLQRLTPEERKSLEKMVK